MEALEVSLKGRPSSFFSVASKYKARRVYEEILAGRNRTSRSKRKAEVEVEAEAEAEVEIAGGNAGLGMRGEIRARGSDDVRGRRTNSQAKRRWIAAASSAAKEKGRACRYRPYIASSKHLIS